MWILLRGRTGSENNRIRSQIWLRISKLSENKSFLCKNVVFKTQAHFSTNLKVSMYVITEEVCFYSMKRKFYNIKFVFGFFWLWILQNCSDLFKSGSTTLIGVMKVCSVNPQLYFRGFSRYVTPFATSIPPPLIQQS